MTPKWLIGGLKNLIEDGLDAAVRWFLTQIFAALETVLNGLGSWWLGVEAPGMGPGSASEAVSNSTLYFVAVAGIIGTAIGIIRVVRTHSRESVADLAMAIFATIATTAIGGTVASYLLTITSQLSPWLLETISGASGDERKSLYTALGFMPASTTSKMAIGIAMIAIFLVVLAAIASLVNMFFVLFTYGVIAVLVGLLPIFAAQSQTEAGKQRFWKVVGWIFAAVLYKPTAAIIYGVGILWIKGIVPNGQESNEVAQIITLLSGFMITAMSCIALPALIRLVSVSTREHASGISAGGAIAAGAGAVAVGSLGLAAVATGGASAGAGAAGVAGATGAGSSGAAGAAGATGAGSAGSAGTSGAGAAGISGSAGAAGAGESGATGAAGSAGASGAESSASSTTSGVGSTTTESASPSGSVASGAGGASGAPGTSGNPGSTGSGSVPAGTSAAGGGAHSPSTQPSAPSVASGSQGMDTPAQPAPAMDAPAPASTGGPSESASSPVSPESGDPASSRSVSTHSPASSTTASGSSPAPYRPAQQVLSPNMSRALGVAARGTSNAVSRHMRDVETQLEN